MGNAQIFLSFFQETFQRLFTKSPLFFKIWSMVFAGLVLITGLPDFVNTLHINGINIPNLWNDKITVAVAWASRAALLMSMLTSQSKPVTTSTGGQPLKVTDAKMLPFTAATEQKIKIN